MKKSALFYEKLAKNKLRCLLCPHQCEIGEGKSGRCRTRINDGGQLYSLNYGQVSSAAVDPIEKKPLYHFYPGSQILSIGTYGCNFNCTFCQNWQISQQKPSVREFSPREVIELARARDVIGIAYTYSEPAIWYEFIAETCKLARQKQLKNVLVTNGFISQPALKQLLPNIDAVNIDLKAFSDQFYRQQCSGSLEVVKDNIVLLTGNKDVHLEVTTLLIPGLNDSKEELIDEFNWLSKLDQNIPLHLTRYFPNYKMDLQATPLNRMNEAYQLAGESLNHVYLGNIRSGQGSDTFCPECDTVVIKRDGYQVKNLLQGRMCPVCGYQISGQF